jgi:hypothetical protein
MYPYLSSLLAALVMTGVFASVEPAQAQISIRIGPPPSPYHFWVPERRYWHGRRYVRVPGRWERRAYRREHWQTWRQHQRWEERRALRREIQRDRSRAR